MARLRFVTLGVVILLVAACGRGGATNAPSARRSAAPTAGSQPPAETAVPTQDACAKENLETLDRRHADGRGGQPRIPAVLHRIEDPEAGRVEWELGQPPNGKGLESATAYAVAEQLGFTRDEVTWVRRRSTSPIQPGPKTFDMY